MSFNNGYFQYIMLDIYAVIAVEINIRYQIIGQMCIRDSLSPARRYRLPFYVLPP